jgi:cell pole-organizing protein PopZ
MSQAAKAQEPSMEEILASIRRIIADDDTGKPAPPPRPVAPPPPAAVAPPPSARMDQSGVDAVMASMDAPVEPPPPPEDVLELTESMTAPDPVPAFQTIDGQPDVVFTDAAPVPPEPRYVEEPRRVAPPPPPPPPMPAAAVPPQSPLISNSTAAAVDSAFNSLAQTVLIQNARTLEDLVREMLRPLLKGWLDDNLPSMVERIVRQEIERVSRGRGT